MSERYIRLFSLTENLYAEGSPVLIKAGALLKDTVTGNVLAQIKMRNIGGKSIKAVTVRISSFDTVKQSIGEVVEHQYLDLTAERDEDFGQKEAVILPEASTRSFDVVVSEVIFSDNSTWNASDRPWEPLQEPTKLADTIEDAELLKQYRLTYGMDCNYSVKEELDLWYCACGALNRRDEANCHKCNKDFAALQSVDFDALSVERDERLQQEQQQREETAIRQKEKRKKIIKIGAPILAVFLIICIFASISAKKSQAYNDAVAMLEDAYNNMNYSEYEKALSTFEKLGDYKDSLERVKECKYEYAMLALSGWNDYNPPDDLFVLGCKKLEELPDDYENTAMIKEICSKYLPYYGQYKLSGVGENKDIDFNLTSNFVYDPPLNEGLCWDPEGEGTSTIAVDDTDCLLGYFPIDSDGKAKKSYKTGNGYTCEVEATFNEDGSIDINAEIIWKEGSETHKLQGSFIAVKK